jgi:transposase
VGDHRAVHAAAGADGPASAWTMREIMNAIFYVLRAGCAWRCCPRISRR